MSDLRIIDRDELLEAFRDERDRLVGQLENYTELTTPEVHRIAGALFALSVLREEVHYMTKHAPDPKS